MPKILVVDDNPSVLKILDFLLTDAGHTVALASTGAEGIRLCGVISPALVIQDVHMPMVSGFDVCRAVKLTNPALPVLMVTGCPTAEVLRIARECGAAEVIRKPFEIAELMVTISRLLTPDKAVLERSPLIS